MHILILLSALFLWNQGHTFENPFKPGRGTFIIADKTTKITRSTSCRPSRHRGWRREHSCVCCLLKRGIRPSGFRAKGKDAFDYCTQKKKYCTETQIAVFARRYGMKYRPRGFNYAALHRSIYNRHAVHRRSRSYRSFFANFFKRSRRSRQTYTERSSTKSPRASRLDTTSFAEEQAERREEATLSAEDRAAYESGNPGAVEIILYKKDAVAFGRLLRPVNIDGTIYPYIVVKYDKLGPELRDRRFIIFPNIDRAMTGRRVDLFLKPAITDGVITGTNIQATSRNTVMPRSAAR